MGAISDKLNKSYVELRNEAKETLVNLLKSVGGSVDFTVDNKGRKEDDEDYDQDWVSDNRPMGIAFCRDGILDAFILKMWLNEKGEIEVNATDIEFEYDFNVSEISWDISMYLCCIACIEEHIYEAYKNKK